MFNPLAYYPGNSLYNADYDGDELCYMPIPDSEKSLIGKVLILTAGDKGPMFRKKGLRILFGHNKCNLKPGAVLVEDIILKEKFGFIIGKNIELKQEFTEEDYIHFLSKDCVEFRSYDNGDLKAAMVAHTSLFCYGFIGTDNTPYDSDILYTDLDHKYKEFSNKYFLSNAPMVIFDITYPFNIFTHVYFSLTERVLWNNVKDDARFTLSMLGARQLGGKTPEEIKELLESNKARNLTRLEAMPHHLRNITKNLSSSSYDVLGRMAAIIKQFQADHN
jgi:hypothetical protein